jgi:uncharacterized membrane protein YhiD involved in acid resistance
VKGITTAASLWATAAIGKTTGLDDYEFAEVARILVVAILASTALWKRIGLEKH